MIRDKEEYLSKSQILTLKNPEEERKVSKSTMEIIGPKGDQVIEKCFLDENQVPCYMIRFKIKGDALYTDFKMVITNSTNNQPKEIKLSDINGKFVRIRKFSEEEKHYCIFLKCEDFGFRNCCEPYNDICTITFSQYGYKEQDYSTEFFIPSINPDVNLEKKCDCF